MLDALVANFVGRCNDPAEQEALARAAVKEKYYKGAKHYRNKI
jgi:hypothetical protein